MALELFLIILKVFVGCLVIGGSVGTAYVVGKVLSKIPWWKDFGGPDVEIISMTVVFVSILCYAMGVVFLESFLLEFSK